MLPVVLAQMSILQYPLGILLFLVSLFLILLILVQRGRGGGLTGALGGMGGQSAFGSKAGDLFTRVTVIVASVWIVLCLLIIVLFDRPTFGPSESRRKSARNEEKLESPAADDVRSEGADGGTSGSSTSGGSTTSNGTGGDDAAP